MINPMRSLPGFGAILKNRCKLDTEDEDRTLGDLYAACIDFLIHTAWSYLGLFEDEEKKHRSGMSIMEVQEFLDWVFKKFIEDMEWDIDELNREFDEGVSAFMERSEEA